MKIYLHRCHAQTVGDGDLGHKNTMLGNFRRFLNSNALNLQYWFGSYSDFDEWVDLPTGEVASGRVCACAAVLFLFYYFSFKSNDKKIFQHI